MQLIIHLYEVFLVPSHIPLVKDKHDLQAQSFPYPDVVADIPAGHSGLPMVLLCLQCPSAASQGAGNCSLVTDSKWPYFLLAGITLHFLRRVPQDRLPSSTCSPCYIPWQLFGAVCFTADFPPNPMSRGRSKAFHHISRSLPFLLSTLPTRVTP